jgi:subtilisin family serine protease
MTQVVRVAIIDSGVDRSVRGGVQDYVSIRQRPGSANLEYEYGVHADEAGHGTACAILARKLAPRCEIYSVKVLGARCLGRASALMAGIRWAIDHRMHVCNLSLGTVREEHAEPMRALSEEAAAQGLVLVAAANDRGVPSYPARCPAVISVAAHAIPDPLTFWPDPSRQVDFVCWGTNVPIQSADGTWTHGRGSSLAAAHMTGLIAAILETTPGLNVWEIKGRLHFRVSAPRDGRKDTPAYALQTLA